MRGSLKQEKSSRQAQRYWGEISNQNGKCNDKVGKQLTKNMISDDYCLTESNLLDNFSQACSSASIINRLEKGI